MSDFTDIQLKALVQGILLDSCGLDTRDYSWGVYTDLCGMSYEDALKTTQAPGNVAIGQLIINKCDCNCKCHDGSSTGNTTGSTTTVNNVVYFALNSDGELVLTFKEATQGDVNLTFTMDGTPYTVSVPNGVLEYNTHYKTTDPTLRYSEIKNVTYSSNSANYKYTITNNVKDGYFLLTVKVDNATVKTEKVKYNSAITLPEEKKVGYTFAWDNEVATMPESNLTITGRYTVKTYKVTYKLTGYKEEVTIPETAVTFEQQINEPAVAKEGYDLTWNVTFPVKPDDTVSEYSIEGVYAIQSYLLNIIAHFNKNKDDVTILSKNIEYDSEISLYSDTYEGYNFVEWKNAETNMPVSSLTITMPASPLTITGVYELKSFKVNVPTVDGLAFTFADELGNEITPEDGQVTVEYGTDVKVTVTATAPNYIVGTSSFEDEDTTITDMVETGKTYNNAELVTSADYLIDSKQEPDSALDLDFTTNKYFTIDVKNENSDITVEGGKFSIVPESDAYTDADTYTETIKLSDDLTEGYDVVLEGTIGDKDINDFYDADTNTLSIPLNTDGIENGVDVNVSKKKKIFDIVVNDTDNVPIYTGECEYDEEVVLTLTGDTETQMAIDTVEGIPADAEVENIVENGIVLSRRYRFTAKAPVIVTYTTKPYYTITIALDGMEANKENFNVYANDSAEVVLTPSEGKGWINEISYTMGETNGVIATAEDAKESYTVAIDNVSDNVIINGKAEVKKYSAAVTLTSGGDATAVNFADNAIADVESGATYETTVSKNGSNYLGFEIRLDDALVTDTTEIFSYVSGMKYIDKDGAVKDNFDLSTYDGSEILITDVTFKFENVNKNIAVTIIPIAYYSIEYQLGDELSINNDIKVIRADKLDTLTYSVSGTASNVPTYVVVNATTAWTRSDNYTLDGSDLTSITDSFGLNNENVENDTIVVKAISSPVYAMSIVADGDTEMLDDYYITIDGNNTKSAKALAGIAYAGSVDFDEAKATVTIKKNEEEVVSIDGTADSDIVYHVNTVAKEYTVTVQLNTYAADDTPIGTTLTNASSPYKYGTNMGDIPATLVATLVDSVKNENPTIEFKAATTTDTIPSTITGNITITYEMHEKVAVSGAFMGVLKSTVDTAAITEDDITNMSNVDYAIGTAQEVTYVIPANADYQAKEDGFYDGSIKPKDFRTWIAENDNYYLIMSIPVGTSFELIGADGMTDYAEQFTKLNTISLSGNDYEIWGWSDTVDATTVTKYNGISVATMGWDTPTEKTYTLTIKNKE